jgi:hypothetical protein
LDRYSVEELGRRAELVVRAEVGDSTPWHTRDGDCLVHEVRVLATFAGKVAAGDTIRVAGLDEYRSAVFDAEKGRPKAFAPLVRGDVAYLFMVPRGAREGYSMYDLTDAGWKVIESGVRLAAEGHIYDYAQYTPPPPHVGPVRGFVRVTPQTLPEAPAAESVDAFEQHLRITLERVGAREAAPTTGPSTRRSLGSQTTQANPPPERTGRGR